MSKGKLFLVDGVSDNLLSNLDNRDVALWIRGLPKNPPTRDKLVEFLGLPWRFVFSEISDPQLITALERRSSINDPMARKRGFLQIVDNDPSRIQFPLRCLPLYLLNGRDGAPTSEFEDKLRRMTMLEDLRRSGVRQILIISGEEDPIPSGLRDLWASGFRSFLTFASDLEANASVLDEWLGQTDGVTAVSLSRFPAARFIEDIVERYESRFVEERRLIRVRDQKGTFHRIDVTEIDEPERPAFEQYSIIEDRDLTPLTPDEFSEEDFVAFFQNPAASWRPYAAGLPWIRDPKDRKNFESCLKRLDSVGPDENCIAYITSEEGAGGTTLARTLAWEFARDGYPVLVAKPLPFVPDALSIGNLLNRAHHLITDKISQYVESRSRNGEAKEGSKTAPRRYETPWILVFDRMHWEYRDSELRKFLNELKQQGRPVCVLVVTGPIRELSYFDTSVFKQVSVLNHTLDQDEARALGRHLNQFLRVYGKARPDWQWDQFYQSHTVRYLEGVSAFWVTLSFWIQGQYDLSESVQEWMYRAFIENTEDGIIRDAIFEIAAMSSEHLPLPADLLPISVGGFPVSHLLEDRRSSLAALGLVTIAANGKKYWALVHDILGRFLVAALFYDFPMREKLGFADAKDVEHLRFMLLSRISQKRELGERAYKAIGEDFATSIFKIDPDHGRTSFTYFWREVLHALDTMPRSLRDTSRVFRHHVAITRRRIAVLSGDFYGVTIDDKIALLTKAIEDMNFALTSIEYEPGSESNLNLYNSLANAYLNLADAEYENGLPRERIAELRRLANETTRRAYEESPTNSYVVETYVKNLLGNARASIDLAVEYCIEALGILFSTINTDEESYRKPQLAELADQALELLLRQAPATAHDAEPSSALDVLIKAWVSLAEGVDYRSGVALSEIPEQNRIQALDALSHPAGRGNMQAMRLSYDLTCIGYPYAFRRQIEIVEQLQATDYRITPQLRLEYAILLFQNNRAAEGDKAFRKLRRLWRETEHFVQVPVRLRWLRDIDSAALKIVQALTGSDYGYRAMARVQEFNNLQAPFRLEEFGFSDLRPGMRFAAKVSFGHNGPFLRPVTAGPTEVD
jgi:hypothetical protein